MQTYQPLRMKLRPASTVTLCDILSARDALLVIDKVNSNRKATETRINKVIMGDVSTALANTQLKTFPKMCTYSESWCSCEYSCSGYGQFLRTFALSVHL